MVAYFIIQCRKKGCGWLAGGGFCREVIELHDKYLAYVNDCFLNHTLFHKSLKEALEVFCNKGVAGSSSAELLATFCDNILKKGGSEKLSDEAIEETLEKLAWQLLSVNSANDDHERSILTKLKLQCGGRFTSKMEGMVTDLTLARKNQTSFEEHLSHNPNANPVIDLTVTVLTTGFWPSYKSSDLNLPAEMVKCVEVFKEFYQTKTKHRKLEWIYSLGTCNLIGKFESRTTELIVTTYQDSALLLFNSSDRLSYSEIRTQLNLTDDDDCFILFREQNIRFSTKSQIRKPSLLLIILSSTRSLLTKRGGSSLISKRLKRGLKISSLETILKGTNLIPTSSDTWHDLAWLIIQRSSDFLLPRMKVSSQ